MKVVNLLWLHLKRKIEISNFMSKITYAFLLLFSLMMVAPAQSQVVINEILTSNTNINTDEDDTYQDWIELYNSGAGAVNLNGYGLTDDSSLPYKWTQTVGDKIAEVFDVTSYEINPANIAEKFKADRVMVRVPRAEAQR